MDAVESYREGHRAGQQMVLDLINRWCAGKVETVAQLVQYIKELENKNDQD
jgi:uncharacterized protein Yka (UPF0111/DUF47 family)